MTAKAAYRTFPWRRDSRRARSRWYTVVLSAARSRCIPRYALTARTFVGCTYAICSAVLLPKLPRVRAKREDDY